MKRGTDLSRPRNCWNATRNAAKGGDSSYDENQPGSSVKDQEGRRCLKRFGMINEEVSTEGRNNSTGIIRLEKINSKPTNYTAESLVQKNQNMI